MIFSAARRLMRSGGSRGSCSRWLAACVSVWAVYKCVYHKYKNKQPWIKHQRVAGLARCIGPLRAQSAVNAKCSNFTITCNTVTAEGSGGDQGH